MDLSGIVGTRRHNRLAGHCLYAQRYEVLPSQVMLLTASSILPKVYPGSQRLRTGIWL